MTPRLLPEAEFKATLSDRMVDINGREDLVSDGVIDLDPHLRAAESGIAPLELLSDTPPAAVYRSADGRFDHVLYPCNRSNVYVVVVVTLGRKGRTGLAEAHRTAAQLFCRVSRC